MTVILGRSVSKDGILRGTRHHHNHREPSPSPADDGERLNQAMHCATKISNRPITEHDETSPRWKAVEYFLEGSAGQLVKLDDCDVEGSFFSTMYSLILIRESLNITNPSWYDRRFEIRELDDICSGNRWKRIKCGTVEGKQGITELSLNNANLHGTIPPEVNVLRRTLQFLYLYSNTNLIGSIPEELSLLTNLQDLQIHYSGVSGTIPTSLGQLTSLKRFLLHGTKLTGTMPEEVCYLHEHGSLDTIHANCNHQLYNVQCDVECCTQCKSE